MADTKFLNLDEFVEEKRSVTINGATFVVRSMSVEEFIKEMKEEAEEAAYRAERSLGEPTLIEKLEKILRKLPAMVEGVDESMLRKLQFRQLNALMQFARGEDVAPEVAPKETDSPR